MGFSLSRRWQALKDRWWYLRRRLHVFVDFRWEGYAPKLVVHEGYEAAIKWTLRIVTAIGLGTSLLTIAAPLGVLISVALVATEQFLERTTFRFTTLFIQPLPDFEYDSEEWEAMVFLIDKRGRDAIGCLFQSDDYGRKFFEYVRGWNYDEGEDSTNNIQLSFVVKGSDYYTFLYPSADRRGVRKAADDVELEKALEEPGKEHFQILLQLVFCKGFVNQEPSSLEIFVSHHPNDEPFLLAPLVRDSAGGLRQIAPGILKTDYSFYEWDRMTGEEFEYEYLSRPESGA